MAYHSENKNKRFSWCSPIL